MSHVMGAIWTTGLAALVTVPAVGRPAPARIPVSAKPVSIRAQKEPLGEVLTILGRASGARLSTVAHLRERRVSLFVKGGSLGSVMRGLARAWSLPRYPASWIRPRGDGPDTVVHHHLWQRAEAATEGSQREARDRVLLMDQVRRLMDFQYRPQVVDPSTIERRPEDIDHDVRLLKPAADYVPMDPRIGRWGAGWAAAVGGLLREMTPKERDSTLRGDAVYVPTSRLSPRTYDLIFLLASGTRRGLPKAEMDGPRIGGVRVESLEERRRRFDGERVSFRLLRDVDRSFWVPLLSIEGANDLGPLPSPIGFSEALDEASGGNPDAPRALPLSKTGGQRTNIPIKPEQRNRIEVRLRDGLKDLPAAQQLLHEVLSVTVVSDYYSRPPSYGRVVTAAFRTALKEPDWDRFLDQFAAALSLRWERHAGTLLFRHRTWWIEDEAEVPQEVARRLTEAHGKRGYLNLAELCAVAALTDRQHDTLLADYLPAEPVQVARILRPWAQFRLSLPPEQRQRLEKPDGLAMGVTPSKAVAQLLQMDRLLRQQLEGIAQEELRGARLRFSLELEGRGRFNQRATLVWAGVVLPGGRFVGHRLEQSLQ